MYVQDLDKDSVSFVGASRSKGLTYGSPRTHQFLLGELVFRPHLVLATDKLKGHGLAALATSRHYEIIRDTEGVDLILDVFGQVEKIRKEAGFRHDA